MPNDTIGCTGAATILIDLIFFLFPVCCVHSLTYSQICFTGKSLPLLQTESSCTWSITFTISAHAQCVAQQVIGRSVAQGKHKKKPLPAFQLVGQCVSVGESALTCLLWLILSGNCRQSQRFTDCGTWTEKRKKTPVT